MRKTITVLDKKYHRLLLILEYAGAHNVYTEKENEIFQKLQGQPSGLKPDFRNES